jgi:predicted DNA-binding transcriptional regulator AlpA
MVSSPQLFDSLLNERQTSSVLNLSVRTLQSWRSDGRGPPYVKTGRAIRYRIQDLIEWIAVQTVTPKPPSEGN